MLSNYICTPRSSAIRKIEFPTSVMGPYLHLELIEVFPSTVATLNHHIAPLQNRNFYRIPLLEMDCAMNRHPTDYGQAEMKIIDGSNGGQGEVLLSTFSTLIKVLRNATAYACILGIPIRIENIRPSKSVSGIKSQQLHGVELQVVRLSRGHLEGASVGGDSLTLYPRITHAYEDLILLELNDR